MRIRDGSSDVCSSDLHVGIADVRIAVQQRHRPATQRADIARPERDDLVAAALHDGHRQLTGAAFEAGRNASLQSDRPAFARPPGLDPAQGTMRACGKFPVATMQSREAAQPVRDLLDAQGPGRVTWIGTACDQILHRSEERRVWKECVSTCRFVWSTYHYNKKKR